MAMPASARRHCSITPCSRLMPLSVSLNSGKSRKQSLYPDSDPDHHQNLIICSLAHCQPSLKISCKSIWKFLPKVANRQTNKFPTEPRHPILIAHWALPGAATWLQCIDAYIPEVMPPPWLPTSQSSPKREKLILDSSRKSNKHAKFHAAIFFCRWEPYIQKKQTNTQ